MDTIVAIATGLGYSGIGIVRISGNKAKSVLQQIFRSSKANFVDFKPYTLHHGKIINQAEILDDVLAVFMPGPKTFTGEDIVEIQCHGGSVLVQSILELVLSYKDIRLAERGEFSRRAFLNGRIDLSQAEAIAELISAPSREAAKYCLQRLDGHLSLKINNLKQILEKAQIHLTLGLDFEEAEVGYLDSQELHELLTSAKNELEALLANCKRSQILLEGVNLVLTGAVNAGKSSLLNALLGHNRAIVTEHPGTTRDFLEEKLNLDGLLVRITDTAGLRETLEPIEAIGIAAAKEKVKEADAILALVDGANLIKQFGKEASLASLCPEENLAELLANTTKPVIIVWNKVDLCPEDFWQGVIWPPKWANGKLCLKLSAKTGAGLEELIKAMRNLFLEEAKDELASEVAPNRRQALALEKALAEINLLIMDLEANISYDCLSTHLDSASAYLAEVIGQNSPEEILNLIFQNFCIGK